MRFSWHDFRVFVEHLGTNSALFRARHPRSWQWDVNTEFLSAILHVLQGANWQRSGGRGKKPKHIRRPDDSAPVIDTKIPVSERKASHDGEIARRRAARDKRRANKHKSRLIKRGVVKAVG